MSSLKQISFKGISMWPFLKEGDILNYEETHDIKLGELVLIVDNGEILCHRLIKIKDNNYIFKGDRSLYEESLDSNHIIGKVHSVNRNNKTYIPNISLHEMITQLSQWTSSNNPKWLRYFSLIIMKLITPIYLVANS